MQEDKNNRKRNNKEWVESVEIWSVTEVKLKWKDHSSKIIYMKKKIRENSLLFNH